MGILCILGAGLSACAMVGPDYQAPEIPAPAQWQAPMAHAGSEASLRDWWQRFDDPLLLDLLEAAAADSPSLDQAWANIESARASLASVRAGLAPDLDGNASITRARQQQGDGLEVLSSRSAGFDASWEIDLFGKLRRGAEQARARLQARIGDWHAARVSLAAEVADNYTRYRGCQLLVGAYEQELASMGKTAEATAVSVRAGLTAPADGALARASLASTQSSLQAQRLECGLLVKALVALTGLAEGDLLARLGEGGGELPRPVAFRVQALPADMLRQRPDIAVLERELAAASAAIGAAQAELYPSLSLSGDIAIGASSLASSATTWSFGPSLSLPLFDGGRRLAAVDSAEADYQAALAQWRQGVRSAVEEVEQALLRLDGAAFRSERARQAAEEYRAYFAATEVRWRAGSASLLDLEDARRSALSTEIDYLGLLRDQVQYWIALYKASGGGWTATAADRAAMPGTREPG